MRFVLRSLSLYSALFFTVLSETHCEISLNAVIFGNEWEKRSLPAVERYFFSGSECVKIDKSGRFVIPQEMRFGLVENGKLEFTIALGFGGCLTIYRKSAIAKVIDHFRGKEHQAKYQRFFTLFFSTLANATCDDKGRVLLPPLLKKAIGLPEKEECELVVAGVLNKIEIWPAEKYQNRIAAFLTGENGEEEMTALFEEALSIMDEEKKSEGEEQPRELEV